MFYDTLGCGGICMERNVAVWGGGGTESGAESYFESKGRRNIRNIHIWMWYFKTTTFFVAVAWDDEWPSLRLTSWFLITTDTCVIQLRPPTGWIKMCE